MLLATSGDISNVAPASHQNRLQDVGKVIIPGLPCELRPNVLSMEAWSRGQYREQQRDPHIQLQARSGDTTGIDNSHPISSRSWCVCVVFQFGRLSSQTTFHAISTQAIWTWQTGMLQSLGAVRM